MGTWDTGPFDNDSAADFASDIRTCTDAQARHDLLLATLGAGTEKAATADLTDEYSWGYELEHAVAAAAFTADEYTGTKQFTDTSYARGVSDSMELEPYVEIRMSDDLVAAARSFTARMLSRMRGCRIDREWVKPVVDIGFALSGGRPVTKETGL